MKKISTMKKNTIVRSAIVLTKVYLIKMEKLFLGIYYLLCHMTGYRILAKSTQEINLKNLFYRCAKNNPRLIKQGKNTFVAYGAAHAVMQERAIRKLTMLRMSPEAK